jgi:hypothetical protein
MVLIETSPPNEGNLEFQFFSFNTQYLNLFLFQGGDDFVLIARATLSLDNTSSLVFTSVFKNGHAFPLKF